MKLCILLMALLLCVHSTWSQDVDGASSTPHGPSTTTKPDSATTSPKTSPESTKTTATTEKTTATTEKTTTTTEKTTGATKAPTLGETKTKATEETVKNPGSVPNVTFHSTTAAPTNKSANVPTSVATTNSSTSGTDAHLSGTTTGSEGEKPTKKGGKYPKKSGKEQRKSFVIKHIKYYSNSSLMDFLQHLEKEAIHRGLRVGNPKAPTQKVAPFHTESPKTTATTEKTTATTEKTTATTEKTTGATKAPAIGETKTKATEETMKNPGPKPANRTPDSSHFAVVFLVMIAILFGLYALYHNRQKIIAVVVEGRSANGHGGRDRYRKLDNESLEPEARVKNSNEVYVY